jgi:predicted DsbA family dithiol-disulfide isomerase
MSILTFYNSKLGGMIRQTTRAHRLLTLAYRTGGSALQLALLEHLFNATHVEEKDIGNVELLAYYADKARNFTYTTYLSRSPTIQVGLLPKATAERWLRTHDLETDVRRLVKISVQGCGIAGVPFVVINGKWAIGGGEDRSVYYKIFEKVWRGNQNK